MKFSIKTSDDRKRKVYIDNNDISKCVTGLRIDIEPMLGDKKYRIVEEV